jgi:hypothetical protein
VVLLLEKPLFPVDFFLGFAAVCPDGEGSPSVHGVDPFPKHSQGRANPLGHFLARVLLRISKTKNNAMIIMEFLVLFHVKFHVKTCPFEQVGFSWLTAYLN